MEIINTKEYQKMKEIAENPHHDDTVKSWFTSVFFDAITLADATERMMDLNPSLSVADIARQALSEFEKSCPQSGYSEVLIVQLLASIWKYGTEFMDWYKNASENSWKFQ